MIKEEFNNWHAANQQYLMAAVQLLYVELENFAAGRNAAQGTEPITIPGIEEAQTALNEAKAALPAPAAFETLSKHLNLSGFEQKILLICAGVELDSAFAALIAGIQGNPMQPLPSFGMAMAVFADAHWTALSPASPLRYWRLVELTGHPILTRSPLKIDEQILHYITGINQLDDRLSEIAGIILPERILVPSHIEIADLLTRAWLNKADQPQQLPILQLQGDESGKAGIAATTASNLGKTLYRVSAAMLPVTKNEYTGLLRLWNREALLNQYALFLDCTELDSTDKMRLLYVQQFIDNIKEPLFLSVDIWSPAIKRTHINAEVRKPSLAEQSLLWKEGLQTMGSRLNGQLDKLVSQFNLNARIIEQVSAEMITQSSVFSTLTDDPDQFKRTIWKLCCKYTRPNIDELAQRIEPVATWDTIVLPAAQKETLREIATQVKQRKKVYDEWGFGSSSSRGLGINAMFTGESGTGKTMAAEVLANELQLDLYRIDLSQVVNKYIGETEKNLKRVFDAAEDGGAILLFDEADALFGKRSEVKDSHDRYGNIEVSYLLQRMEAYRGLAILTTNMKNALDKAFLRRIRFIVQFPFPGIAQRAEIWSKVFPVNTPVHDLDFDKLAKLSLPGGNIRNIAMNAAFVAAEEEMAVGMSQLLRAARSEYNKLEKPMNNIE